MYDQKTGSLWPQILATSIEGRFKGESLKEFNVYWTTWEDWRNEYPETKVMTEDTGYIRNYNLIFHIGHHEKMMKERLRLH